jgi:transcriptional regulator of acetoin/glycerol metabolism
VESLLLYDWPLNLRELVLLTRRLNTLHPREKLKRSMLPERMLATSSRDDATSVAPAPRKPTDDDQAFNALLASLRDHAGNLTKAATALGWTRARAYRLLDARPEFDLDSARKGRGA